MAWLKLLEQFLNEKKYEAVIYLYSILEDLNLVENDEAYFRKFHIKFNAAKAMRKSLIGH